MSSTFVLPSPTPTCEHCNNYFREVPLSVDPRLVDRNGVVEHGFTFCTEFESELTRPQLHVCRREKNYLGCFALGMRRAVQWCVRVFNQSKWNCSYAVRELVFGRMVHTMNVRERSAVVSMVSAAVMYDLTACCRERMLADCSCNYSLSLVTKTFDEDGKLEVVYGGCSDRLDVPSERTKTLLKVDRPPAGDCDCADQHNVDVGLKMATDMVVHCHCHGLTAACNLKTCKHRMKPYANVANQMLTKYDGAVKVTKEENGRFVPSNTNADPPTDSDLVYFCDSPDLCRNDPFWNTPGTANRKCDLHRQGRGSCDQLCCGRGHYKRTKVLPVYDFDFDDQLYKVVRRVMGHKTVTEYFCN